MTIFRTISSRGFVVTWRQSSETMAPLGTMAPRRAWATVTRGQGRVRGAARGWSEGPALVLTGGMLVFKPAPDGTDSKVFLNAGALVARLAPVAGDRRLTLAAGQVAAGPPA